MAKRKPKTVVGLSGSPRKGANTDVVVEEILAGAKAVGARTQFIRLADLDISGCVACYACEKTGKCGRKDDMALVYRALERADAWVLGTPVYWFTMSAQMKAPVDRFFAWATNPKGSPVKGKRAAVVTLSGDSDVKEMAKSIFDPFAKGFKFLGVRFAARMALQGVEKEKAKKRWTNFKPARRLGARLAQ